MISIRKQILFSLTYFLIAASLGVVLRLFPVTSINANYKYIIHTHSHIALLGWVYVALTAIIFHLFIREEAHKKYSKIFWCTQITIIGMLFSFPFTGYALLSIIFSTLFLICSYWFYVFFRKNNNCNKNRYSYKLINASLLFMVFSSIGPWALGIIMNTLGNTSHWYKNAIYFYLHFQYNGWFILCLLGVFFFILEKHKIQVDNAFISPFYKYIIISTCLTLFLSFLWMKPNKFIYFLSMLGIVYQIIALGKFHLILTNYKRVLIKKIKPSIYKLLKFIYFLLVFKVVLQFLSAIPYFAILISQIKDFVIGYLHLIFLGIVSLSLFAFLDYLKILKISPLGMKFYLLGFILSESLIIYKGFCNWQQLSIFENYYTLLVFVSSFLVFGILLIYLQNLRRTN